MNAISAEDFRRQVDQMSGQMPGGVTETVERLRRESARPEGLRADPLALPGGAAGERAWHDREAARRQQFKALLAGNKLHAGLVVAALGREGPGGAPDAPGVADDGAADDGVTDYVARAGRWIEAVTDALARRWGADPAEGATDGAAGGAGLSGYHRYELARTLVAALGELPELPERVDPDAMAAYLAAPAPALPPEPSASAAPAWVSAGPQADRALAWSRALATVLAAAADAPFERPLETVLADARAALTGAAADRVAALDAAFPVPAAARPIVEQHALQTSARLYAATLRHVHRESARMIGRYRALQESGLADEADLLARDYQEGHWGYAGVAHHFRALLAAHAAQQDAALAAMPAPETETAGEVTPDVTPSAADPDRSDTRAPAVQAAGPVP